MKLFLSHSSADKEIVKRLHADLTNNSFECWLDEYSIQVGDCIMTGIEKGLHEAEYVILFLSNNSVNSTWVEKEWKTKYWDEINQNKIKVLPVLIEDCKIPDLLKTKKYADFRTDYSKGLSQLMGKLKNEFTIVNATTPNDAVPEILRRVMDSQINLSASMVDVLSFANKINDKELYDFSLNQLKGYKDQEIADKCRVVSGFASWKKIQNVRLGPGQNIESFWMELKKDTDFIPFSFSIGYSLTQIEFEISNYKIDVNNSYISLPSDTNHIFNESKPKPTELTIYMKGDSYVRIIEALRQKTIELLTNRL